MKFHLGNQQVEIDLKSLSYLTKFLKMSIKGSNFYHTKLQYDVTFKILSIQLSNDETNEIIETTALTFLNKYFASHYVGTVGKWQKVN